MFLRSTLPKESSNFGVQDLPSYNLSKDDQCVVQVDAACREGFGCFGSGGVVSSQMGLLWLQ